MAGQVSIVCLMICALLLVGISWAEHVEFEDLKGPEQYLYKVDNLETSRWKRDDTAAIKWKKNIVKKPTQLDPKVKSSSNVAKITAAPLNVTSTLFNTPTDSNSNDTESEYTADNHESFLNPLESDNTTMPSNMTRKDDSHIYYNSSLFLKSEEAMPFWADMDNKTSNPMPNVTRHAMLSNSYRRAATVNLSFEFPFYGHLMKNVTIATGGFLYLGHPVHSWLAATQYIAPLMANFDTRGDNTSSIKYADNSTAFVIQWENLKLKDKKLDVIDDRFSFQAILKKNGDIVFVYKSVPVNLTVIPDQTHPVKVGLSDAYVIDKTAFFIRKKTIYEYHRAEMKSEPIGNETAIYFTALTTCNRLTTCDTCLSGIPNFDCKWCEKAKKCSDGLDRDRQHWVVNECDTSASEKKNQCPSNSTVFNTTSTNLTPGNLRV